MLATYKIIYYIIRPQVST